MVSIQEKEHFSILTLPLHTSSLPSFVPSLGKISPPSSCQSASQKASSINSLFLLLFFFLRFDALHHTSSILREKRERERDVSVVIVIVLLPGEKIWLAIAAKFQCDQIVLSLYCTSRPEDAKTRSRWNLASPSSACPSCLSVWVSLGTRANFWISHFSSLFLRFSS